MKIEEIGGEFGFIDRFKPWFEELIPDRFTGIGDDCSVIPVNDRDDWIITTDMLVEDVHFILQAISSRQLGYKSLAVNLSDIAAMGGEPVGSFLSLAIPKETDVEYLDSFLKGYLELSEKYNIPLLGGDTTKSLKHLTINVCVIGKCERGKAKRRNMAMTHDIICVTGFLGDSAGGLQILLDKLPETPDNEYLLTKHHLPEPRLNEGLYLGDLSGVHSMMDISDGIASDLVHILKASGKSAIINIEKLPVSDALKRASGKYDWNTEELAISGGEDYELLCTIAPEEFQNVSNSFLSDFGKPLFPVGTIAEGSPCIQWFKNNKEIILKNRGYDHFR
jgi:thiamine-monophosphate kinase